MAKRVTKGNLWGFIQSRPYASVADIRRAFTMEVEDASAVDTSEGRCYIGVTQPVADIIRQLWQEGRILFDLNPDVKARVVQGIYPARLPATRSRTASSGPEMAAAGAPSTEEGDLKRKRRRKRKSTAGAPGAAGTSRPASETAGAVGRSADAQ